ncbi:MAG: class I SAM-dependent methyltransferase [Shewanella sp.]|uniref:class I SAM-dependent methyltransferase n=1 Tax=Shewanella sp. TaxID=50422 RepID=UPI0030039D3F
MDNKYVLFPFNIVTPKAKIAIYGAGEIFLDFKKQIEALSYCEVTWLIDKKFNSNSSFSFSLEDDICNSIARLPPLLMEWQLPDYIVIASISFAEEIEHEILKLKGNLDNVIRLTSKNIVIPSFSTTAYWDQRYISGGDSGAGSYNNLARFKADIINYFVSNNDIKNVIEMGCGDGNQLGLSDYACYIGFDVSTTAIALCKEKFKSDCSKSFKLVSDYQNECADLALSLDVIYHLIEDDIYETYMDMLFSSSSKYIIIYSSNSDLNNGEISPPITHIKHREFTTYIEKNFALWELKEKIANKHQYNGDHEVTSFSNFYIYIKKSVL